MAHRRASGRFHKRAVKGERLALERRMKPSKETAKVIKQGESRKRANEKAAIKSADEAWPNDRYRVKEIEPT